MDLSAETGDVKPQTFRPWQPDHSQISSVRSGAATWLP